MTDLSPATLLIVDDTPANVMLLSEILENKGYQIVIANNGNKAIKIAQHSLPDLILLDIMMPEMDGFETCKQLKQHTLTKDIPVIFISAKTEVDDLVKAFSVGAVDYIYKPFHENEVNARIINHLKIRQLNQQLAVSELNMRNLLHDFQFQTERLQQIVDHVVDGIVEVNSAGHIKFANPAVEKLFGYTAKELHLMNFSQLLAEPFSHQYKTLFNEEFSQKQLLKQYECFSSDAVLEIRAKRKDGSEFPIDFSFIKISLDKEVYLGVIHDITTHQEKVNKFRSLSNTDPLTGLANRRYFEEVFAQKWSQNHWNNKQMAFIMVDIDFFKQFNDTYGHQAGDDCLKQVAWSLKNNVQRPNDIVARIGGEEFAIILPNTLKAGAIHIAEQLRAEIQALNISHSTSKHQVVTISLGIAITDSEKCCSHSKELYQMADKALYEAKNLGRNGYAITYCGDHQDKA